jgi:hypothetical protein
MTLAFVCPVQRYKKKWKEITYKSFLRIRHYTNLSNAFNSKRLLVKILTVIFASAKRLK